MQRVSRPAAGRSCAHGTLAPGNHLVDRLTAVDYRPPRIGASLLLAAVVAAGGCDYISKLSSQVEKEAQQVVAHTVEEVKQQVGTAGSIELDLGGPVATKGCYARLLPISGRPTILQVTSYADADSESYPSFFLRAEAPSAEPGALVGVSLPVEMYLQSEADGAIWHSKPDEPAQIVVRSAAADDFAADLQGVLVNTATGAQLNVTGKMKGTLR